MVFITVMPIIFYYGLFCSIMGSSLLWSSALKQKLQGEKQNKEGDTGVCPCINAAVVEHKSSCGKTVSLELRSQLWHRRSALPFSSLALPFLLLISQGHHPLSPRDPVETALYGEGSLSLRRPSRATHRYSRGIPEGQERKG